MALIVEDRHLRDLISMRDAIEALRCTYAAAAAGEVLEADRSNLILPNGFLRLMAAACPAQGMAGYKEFHRCSGQVRSAYHLFETGAGEPLAVIDADYLTLLRTGACGGLGADLSARPDATALGVIGSGKEARSQVEAVLAVRDITSIKVYSRTAERRNAFCEDIGRRYDVEARPCSEPSAAIDDVDILVVATVTGAGGPPALLGEWLNRPGLHINSIGSTLPAQHEIDEQVWERSDRIVIDAAVLLEESGDALAAKAAGTLREDKVVLLRDVIAGTAVGRASRSEVTLYKSVGSALQDFAIAALAYERAWSSDADFDQIPDFQTVGLVTGTGDHGAPAGA